MRNFCLVYSLVIFLFGCVGSSEKKITAAEAQEICSAKKRSAEGPTGVLSLSTGTKGSSAGATLNFHSNYLIGKDPNSVYVDCMFEMKSKISGI